ncbi:MAG: FtsH protease activity modulator HflK [Gammaproteobacteria bacterium]
MKMTWNKPSEPTPDPWSGKPRQSDGPPELDEVLRKLRDQFNRWFGGKSGKLTPGKNTILPPSSSLWLIAIILFILWVISGIFIVDPSEQAVVLRFGKNQETVGSGPHWIPRFIYSKKIVNTEQIIKYDYEALMLTKDANVVSVKLVVQYRISNPKDYLFNLTSANLSLEQATASALRQIIGQMTLDAVLTVDREKVRKDTRDTLVAILDKYKPGMTITDVSLQQAKAPDEVKEAFDDAIKAQEDEKRFQSQAEAYAKKVQPKAEGQAQRFLADANAYKQQVTLHAQGEVARYLALLPYYQKSPAITRDRLYIDAMETVLSKTSKIIVDTKSSNMIYLPLDKLMPHFAKNISPEQIAAASTITAPVSTPASSAVISEYANIQPHGGY